MTSEYSIWSILTVIQLLFCLGNGNPLYPLERKNLIILYVHSIYSLHHQVWATEGRANENFTEKEMPSFRPVKMAQDNLLMIFSISIILLEEKEWKCRQWSQYYGSVADLFSWWLLPGAWCFSAYRRLVLSDLLSPFLSHLRLFPATLLVHIHSLPPAHAQHTHTSMT